MPYTNEAAILERIVATEPERLSPETARYLLSLDFRPADRQRKEDLAAGARHGTLTAGEQGEFDSYCRVTRLLETWQTKARAVLGQTSDRSGSKGAPSPGGDNRVDIPAGITQSQEAFRRDLPALLANRKLFHWWVAYHGEQQLGTARDATTLLEECLGRGFAPDSYFIGWIDPSELVEEEEVGSPVPECLLETTF